ncbi:MAG: rod shape-determining protein RodA [Acidobacteriota bacterium]|nr:rod shape-determining protein RodA [Blastocatellia bacterium]MDW8240500.1 rod shape-determining protein RodA [Acidobacteriota bacterium]
MGRIRSKLLTDFDWWLLLMALALAGFGIVEIHSAQPEEGYWYRQTIWVSLGLVGFFAVTFLDYRRIVARAWSIYGMAIALLILVLFVGVEVNGARAWFRFGFFNFQPSELAKLATILAVGGFIAKVREQRKKKKDKEQYLSLRELAFVIGIGLLPVFLIMLQPDQGTALTFFPVLAGMILVGGVRPRWIVAAIVLMAIVIGVGWHFRSHFLKPYQLQRIDVVLHPDKADPRSYGYHTMQSNIAVGSGGILGKGIMRGTQSRLKFLPYPHTDFIAAVVAEETGFVGMLCMLGVYLLMLMRMLSHAERSPDQLGMMIVTGVTCLVGFHAVINLGMVVGLLPIMGIPLPLLSYGGSSMIATFLALGLVANVRFHRHVN